MKKELRGLKAQLIDIAARCGHGLCVGVDPHQQYVSQLAQSYGLSHLSPLDQVSWFCRSLLRAAQHAHVGVVKFQLALFEVLGSGGYQLLDDLVMCAKAEGMFVIADGKRGDIQSTMYAYGQAFFDRLNVDAATINPYMGSDVWLAWKPWLVRADPKSIFVVWRTSNPSAGEIQDYGQPALADRLLTEFISSCENHHMLDQVGVVVGSGPLCHLTGRSKELVDQMPMLVPGLGVQGGQVGPHQKNRPWQLWNVSRGLYEPLSDSHHCADEIEFFVRRIQYHQNKLRCDDHGVN